ncbi:hypothetical protein BC833DRAFT_621610 [Globomyces pollinis-pini]|nr:hypothetical protein BC833DRAFT_621610 [Globomyces pollinis-pini]
MAHYQHDDQADSLSHRISSLKQISIDIDSEIQYQKSLMNEMEDDFDGVGGLLKGAMGKLKNLIRSENGSWVWIILVFILCTIGYIYLARF